MDPASRSRIMRAIRKKNSKPEVKVRRLVHALGYRFRLHRSDLPGTPDLALPQFKKAIFVHGCFWHQHADCAAGKGRMPRKRLAYWGRKLRRNVARDARALADLQALGWSALVLWECELSNEELVRRRVESFIRPR